MKPPLTDNSPNSGRFLGNRLQTLCHLNPLNSGHWRTTDTISAIESVFCIDKKKFANCYLYPDITLLYTYILFNRKKMEFPHRHFRINLRCSICRDLTSNYIRHVYRPRYDFKRPDGVMTIRNFGKIKPQVTIRSHVNLLMPVISFTFVLREY